MEDLSTLFANRPPTPQRPLMGLTVLVVEDSRFASEALRLLCLRSGARIRRADTLKAARRHLMVYRPSVIIVDAGLPDGSGLDLIRELANAHPRLSVILATSGDPETEGAARAAGADGFLAKPLASLAAFQEAILAHLPAEAQPPGPRAVPGGSVSPDPVAFADDMAHAAEILSADGDDRALDYITQFLRSVAQSAQDRDLGAAAAALALRRAEGAPSRPEAARIAGMVQERLAGKRAV